MLKHLTSILLFAAAMAVQAKNFHVTLSDNLLVLDEQNRSATIDLVNMSEDPMEFQMTVKNEFEGMGPDGIPLVRWAPAKALVPANQSVAMRVASRLRPDLPPGEYEFRVGAQSTPQRPPVQFIPSNDPKEPAAMSVMVPVMPTLPITVYLRHKIDKPTVEVGPFVPTPNDPDSAGYFPLLKKMPSVSFVGVGQAIRANDQTEVVSRRIHITPRQAQGRFVLPRGKALEQGGGPYCLRVWDSYPGRSKYDRESCS